MREGEEGGANRPDFDLGLVFRYGKGPRTARDLIKAMEGFQKSAVSLTEKAPLNRRHAPRDYLGGWI
jgi:hypothetical protein